MLVHDCIQGTPEWKAIRCGMPTASNFSKLITSTGAPSKSLGAYANLLAAEMYMGAPLSSFDGTVWTERGNDLEADARSVYGFKSGLEQTQVGFITDDAKTYGCSPDSLVGDGGLAEFKCLKAENHIETILYYKKYKKCPPAYVQQTQGQMYVCKREWCDLVFYHQSELPEHPDLPMLIIRQNIDSKIINGLTAQLHKVIEVRDEILKTLRGLDNE